MIRFVPLAWLAACNGGATLPVIDTDTDVADTDDTDVVVDIDTEEALFVEAIAPPIWWRRASEWVDGDPSCPSVAQVDDTNWTITGDGCTTDDGDEVDGAIEFLRGPQGTRVLFDGFRVTRDGATQVYDGEIVLPNDNILAAEYSVRDADENLLYAHDQHKFTTLNAWNTVFDLAAGEATVSGRITDARRGGILDIAGTVTHTGSCDEEPDQGEIVFTGAQPITYTFNGGAICDGCVPYTENGTPGEICPF